MGLNIDEILQSLEEEKTAEANFADGISDTTDGQEESKEGEPTKTAEEAVIEDAPETKETATEDVADDSTEDVADDSTEDIVDESTDDSTEDIADETKEAEASIDSDETEKTAAEYDAQGRIMARAFMDELEKVAVGSGAYMPHTADASKGINELPTGDLPEAGKADAVIGQLKQYEAAAQGSYVQNNGAPMPAPSKAPDETKGAIAADARPDMNQAIGGEAAVEKEAEYTDESSPEDRILRSLYNAYFPEDN
ncbi:MAG: hypothetical protein H8E12_16910 [Rhodobacteraceae bacterium]|nr:hypothetical protein [Paracoccaceae bacterium]